MLYIYVNFNNFVSKKMKKRTTLELVEQSKRVSLYSISFEMDRTTEFERFIRKFEAIEEPWKDTSAEKRELTNIEDKEYMI